MSSSSSLNPTAVVVNHLPSKLSVVLPHEDESVGSAGRIVGDASAGGGCVALAWAQYNRAWVAQSIIFSSSSIDHLARAGANKAPGGKGILPMRFRSRPFR